LQPALLRYGFILALTVMVFAVASPLIVFAVESRVYNPVISVNATVLRPVNSTHLLVRVTVDYRGSLPLSQVTVGIANETIGFDRIPPGGRVQGDMVVPASSLAGAAGGVRVRLAFTLASLYRFNLTLTG
jgi:hypothetical protein